MKKIFTILLIAVCSFQLKAQFSNWTQLNYTYPNSTHGDLRAVAVSAGDTIYAYNRSLAEAVVYSTDGGNTWNELITSDGYRKILKLIPDAQGGIYQIKLRGNTFPDSVSYSNNLGTSWNFVSISTTSPYSFTPYYDAISLHHLHRIDNRGIIYIGEGVSGRNFQYSDDNGATWTTIYCPHQPFSALLASDGTIYITSYNGIHVSTDGGNTWDNHGYVQNNNCYDLYEDPTTGAIYHRFGRSKIRKSTDYGQTWTDAATFQFSSTTSGQLLVTSDGMFYFRGDRAIYEGANDMNFTKILEQTDNTDYITDLTASKHYLYAPINGSIYKYERQATGITDNQLNDLIKMYPNPANDFVTISNVPNGSKVMVTDINGKLVYSSETNSEQAMISTTNFVNGVYIIQIQNNSAVANKKLIVNR